MSSLTWANLGRNDLARRTYDQRGRIVLVPNRENLERVPSSQDAVTGIPTRRIEPNVRERLPPVRPRA
jgi:hypothetical protein